MCKCSQIEYISCVNRSAISEKGNSNGIDSKLLTNMTDTIVDQQQLQMDTHHDRTRFAIVQSIAISLNKFRVVFN